MTLAEPLRKLDDYVRRRDYAGPDPYDGLSSPVGRLVLGRRPRQALVQAVKRSPRGVRSLLGIRPVRMTKSLALFSEGLTVAPWLPDALSRRDAVVDELLRRLGDGGWGYEFDVQTRWGFYPAGSPNIIVTSFVIEALCAAGREIPPSVRSWLEAEMRHPAGYIRYIPGNDSLVHNANVLGARALWRAGGSTDGVRAAVAATVERQRPDGTWPYGEAPGLEWIDNFHTAYVLLGLLDLEVIAPEVRPALDRGVAAWLDRCFAPDGTPRYYADKAGPVDIHNIATAARAVLHLKGSAERHEVVARATLHTLLAAQRSDGSFVSSPKSPPYMRWNQAHAFIALAEATSQ